MEMATPKRLKWAFFAIAVTLIAGCGNKNDSISQAQKKDAAQGVPAPSIAETKAIAEEGFIYGLPIVMNYAVQYAFAVDRDSGQFKAPFNQINNEARVFTYKDTAVVTPNSDTPYSMLWLDLRAEPIVLSVPAVDKKRYYSVQLIDSNTYNYGYIGSRATGNDAGDYLVAGPDWKGETPAGIKKVFRSETQFCADGVSYPTVQPSGYAQRDQGSGRLQSAAAVGVPEPAPRRRPPRPSTSRRSTKRWSRPASSSISTSRCNSCPAVPEEEGDSREARAHRHRAGQDLRFQGPLGRTQGRCGPRDERRRRKDRQPLWPVLARTINGWHGSDSLAVTAPSSTAIGCKRAAVAKAGIYGNSTAEAMYPLTRKDVARRVARRQQAQLHAHLRRRAVPTGECLLVGDDV